MTPEEKAFRKFFKDAEAPMEGTNLGRLFLDAKRAIIAEEREACARIIEGGFDLSGTDVVGNRLLRDAAAAIRGRK